MKFKSSIDGAAQAAALSTTGHFQSLYGSAFPYERMIHRLLNLPSAGVRAWEGNGHPDAPGRPQTLPLDPAYGRVSPVPS